MSKITYNTTTSVYLDGKLVGRIHEEKRSDGVIVYQYFPKGEDISRAGEQFATLALCKRSLES